MRSVEAAPPAAATAVLLGCILPPPSGPWLLAAGATLLPVSLMALAAGRHGVTRSAHAVFFVLAIVLGGTLTTLIWLHRAGTTGTTGLLLQLAGLWFLPLLLTGLGYAATFASLGPSDQPEPAREPEDPRPR